MRKVIVFFIAILITGFVSGQSNTFKYVVNADGGVKASLGATANVVSYADYVIDKVGSTYYARPGIGTTYTAYSGASFKTVIEAAMAQLTSGGVVMIKGNFVNIDPFTVPVDNITIQGEGKYLTSLTQKASADVGATAIGLINCSSVDYFTLEYIELDGNGANQTKIDNQASATATSSGVLARSGGTHNTHTTVNDCYIHDFTMFGAWLADANYGLIQDCRISDNYWNNIQVSYGSLSCKVLRNYLEGSCDVSISSGGQDCVIEGNTITDMTGTHGTGTSSMGIGLEALFGVQKSYRVRIINNTITGAAIDNGIKLANNSVECMVSGNNIHDLAATLAYGIKVDSGHYNTISNNKLNRISLNAISLTSCVHSTIIGNDIAQGVGNIGISLQGTSNQNKILSNNIISTTEGIRLVATSDSNYIIGNVISSNGWNNSIVDLGPSNVYKSNYTIIGDRWLPESGKNNIDKNPSADGLAAGILAKGSQNISVYSLTSVDYILSLPAASASTIGTRITGSVPGTYGFELRVQAAQASSVYLNGVTTNKEAAIPVNSSFEVIQIDATHWILKAWDSTGDVLVIVPDAF